MHGWTQNMLEAFKIFILSTIAITLWTAFLLLQDKRSFPTLNRWFAVFLLALTAPQMDLYAGLAVQGGIFQLSLVASTFLWLKGPFIWVFLKILTRDQVNAKKILVHFAPWLLASFTLLYFPETSLFIMLLGMSHMTTYLIVSLWRLINKRTYIADVWQGFSNTAYYWLLYVILGLMFLVAIDFVVISLVTLGIFTTYDFLDYFIFPAFSIYVLSVAILSVYRPELLFRESVTLNENELVAMDHIKINLDQSATGNISPVGVDQKARYLELDVTAAQLLTLELTQLMQDKQLYRQNELSLSDLARTLGISVHQLSELLNVHLGKSFYEFINGYRLQFACGLLKSSKCQLRILDIAFEAGFNNKNSFYRTFKDALGITPNQYREQLDKQELKSI
jgi:AraC-like DNA-binding protein